MDFCRRKQQAMASLVSCDRSRKGGVDAPIIDLINFINKHPSYYTTSSCSGRISILQELPAEDKKLKKKAGDWIFVTHEVSHPDLVLNLLFAQNLQNEGIVVFRFEPFILALDCSDISAAQSIVASAISSGFRESGITSIGKRIMVALRCSIRMEVPIADKGQMLVSRDYITFLVNLANTKMGTNRKRIDKFFKVFQEQAHCEANMRRVVSQQNEGSLPGSSEGQMGPVTGNETDKGPISSVDVGRIEGPDMNVEGPVVNAEGLVAIVEGPGMIVHDDKNDYGS